MNLGFAPLAPGFTPLHHGLHPQSQELNSSKILTGKVFNSSLSTK